MAAQNEEMMDDIFEGDCLHEQTIVDYLAKALDGAAAAQVRAHIESCPACRTVVAETARSSTLTPAGSGPTGRLSLRTLADGEVIAGRYAIVSFIARGGMGEVYEAQDLILGETVALKTLICTGLDDHEAIARLKAEVQLARKVSHPNVCRILEFGLHERELPRGVVEPLPFLTMEFLKGQTLRQFLSRKQSLADEDAKSLFLQLVNGLVAIHAAGVVHRDLKSDNVFVVGEPSRNGSFRLVVMDFGLARPTTIDQVRTLSNNSALAGTSGYMAPEQFRGRPASVATDIYSLGVIMFEVLTGSLPFSEETPFATALKKMESRAPRASALTPHVGRGLDDLIQACLEPDPRRRIQDLQTVQLRLEQPAKSPHAGYAWVGPSVGALALTMAAGAVYWTTQQQKAEAPQPQQVSAAATPPSTPVPEPARQPTEVALPLPEADEPPAGIAPAEVLPPTAAPSPRHKSLARPKARKPQPLAPSVAEESAQKSRNVDDVISDAQHLMAEGKITQACQMLERGKEVVHDAARLYRELGKCYMRAANVSLAKKNYQRYLELSPNAPDIVFVREILK